MGVCILFVHECEQGEGLPLQWKWSVEMGWQEEMCGLHLKAMCK